MMVSLKSFALQHPKIVVGLTMLAIALLSNPATAVSPVIGVILM